MERKLLSFKRLALEKHKRQGKRNDSSRDDDPPLTLQWVAEVLGPLLEDDQGVTLTPSQADAIRRLRAAADSDDDGDDRNPHRQRSLIAQSIGRRWSRLRRSIEDTFQSHEDDDNTTETYQDVMQCFGGGEMLEKSVVIQTRRKGAKKIALKHSIVNHDRLDMMLTDYDQAGARRLVMGRLSDLSVSQSGNYFYPPEWDALAAEGKAELASLLTWESLSRWDFDILRVRKLTRHPLLLVGWALLCPMAQEAMDLSVGAVGEKSFKSYDFHEDLTIDPGTICNFLREVEKRYKHDLPFHSNVHAADVTQTTHCLFQMMDGEYLSRICDPLAIFSLLLAATFHDVGHPGTNNLFERNAMTPMAIRYNDVSVLENMHSAIGHSLLFGEEKKKDWDVFVAWSLQEKARARSIMTSAILGTDMSAHFAKLDALHALTSAVEALGDSGAGGEGDDASEPVLATLARTRGRGAAAADVEQCNEFIDAILKFLLHAADISNPSKKEELAVHWAEGALAEFFAQGDKEKDMDLPVSPLCDRDTVKKPDSQIGFIKFVIQPTFELLGEIIPRVNEVVLPRIQSNLEYWQKEKMRLSESQ